MEKIEFLKTLNEKRKLTNQPEKAYGDKQYNFKDIYNQLIGSYQTYQYIPDENNRAKEKIPFNKTFPTYEESIEKMAQLILESLKNDTYFINYECKEKSLYSNIIPIVIKGFNYNFQFLSPFDSSDIDKDKGYRSFVDSWGYNNKIYENVVDFMVYATIKEKFKYLILKEQFQFQPKGSMFTLDYGIIVELKND